MLGKGTKQKIPENISAGQVLTDETDHATSRNLLCMEVVIKI